MVVESQFKGCSICSSLLLKCPIQMLVASSFLSDKGQKIINPQVSRPAFHGSNQLCQSRTLSPVPLSYRKTTKSAVGSDVQRTSWNGWPKSLHGSGYDLPLPLKVALLSISPYSFGYGCVFGGTIVLSFMVHPEPKPGGTKRPQQLTFAA